MARRSAVLAALPWRSACSMGAPMPRNRIALPPGFRRLRPARRFRRAPFTARVPAPLHRTDCPPTGARSGGSRPRRPRGRLRTPRAATPRTTRAPPPGPSTGATACSGQKKAYSRACSGAPRGAPSVSRDRSSTSACSSSSPSCTGAKPLAAALAKRKETILREIEEAKHLREASREAARRIRSQARQNQRRAGEHPARVPRAGRARQATDRERGPESAASA